MKIGLVKIHGISKENSLYFPSGVDMENIFNTYGSIYNSTAYYPPHYKNTIKLSTTDFNFKSNVNYVMLQYDSKNYYYFINRVSYISEDVIAIDIEMDTIQTFYNDIEINTGVINRRHIKRWNEDGTINRNYVRENISRSEFVLTSRTIYDADNPLRGPDPRYIKDGASGDNVIGYICIRANAPMEKAGESAPIASIPAFVYKPLGFDINVSRDIESSAYMYYIPIVKDRYNNPTYLNGDTHLNEAFNPNSFMGKLHEFSENAIIAFFLPFNVFDTYTYGNTLQQGYYITSGSLLNVDNFGGSPLKDTQYVYVAGDLKVPYMGSTYDTGFVKDTAIDTTFTANHEPSLQDNSYMKVEFGELGAMSSAPLFAIIDTNLYYYYIPDLLYGSRNYVVSSLKLMSGNSTNENYIDDVYGQVVTATTPFTYDIAVSAFNQWYTYNKATMAMGFAHSAFDYSIGAFNVGNQRGSDLSKMYYQLPYLESAEDYDTLRAYNYSSKMGEKSGYARSAQSAANDMWTAGTNYLNAFYSPDKLKTQGSIASDMISRADAIYFRIWKVSDFDYCARYYQLFGNKVNELIASPKTMTALFTEYDTRYYFNYYRFNNLDIHLNNAIEDEATCGRIANRFINGVRFWRVRVTALGVMVLPTIGDYQYDNVEESYVG